MRMKIGDTSIVAKIKEREAAQASSRRPRPQGKSASLLEEQRPNVFTMSVANVLPGDRIEVELHYTELLVPTDGIYEFVYPTVVGPRYVERARAKHGRATTFVASPYTHAGAAPSYVFGVARHVAAGMPIHGSSRRRTRSHDRVGGGSHGASVDARRERRAPARSRLHPALPARRRATSRSGLLLFQGDEGELLPADGAAAHAAVRRRRSRRASTSSSSTCRARCAASRSTPPRS